jgi:hydrogenase maturation protease
VSDGGTQACLHIIGIGSPLAGDDLGWKAITALQGTPFDVQVRWLTLDRPGPSLLDHLDPENPVILIDAMDADLPPGSLRVLRLEDLLLDALPPSSHQFGLAESLALGQALGRLPAQLHIIGIQKPRTQKTSVKKGGMKKGSMKKGSMKKGGASRTETVWMDEIVRQVHRIITDLGNLPQRPQ